MKTNLKEIAADKTMIAYCGLYCGACRSYLSGKCPGCSENAKASWCKIRQCCMENKYMSCADCTIANVEDCSKFNNFMSKIMGLIFNSDRKACIERITENGYDSFAEEMASKRIQTIRRK
jgi:hypothetical protein